MNRLGVAKSPQGWNEISLILDGHYLLQCAEEQPGGGVGRLLEGRLTNFSVHGKSKSFTSPKSSPVTIFRPAWVTHAQLTSALSAFRGQMPMTSSPRMLFEQQEMLGDCVRRLLQLGILSQGYEGEGYFT